MNIYTSDIYQKNLYVSFSYTDIIKKYFTFFLRNLDVKHIFNQSTIKEQKWRTYNAIQNTNCNIKRWQYGIQYKKPVLMHLVSDLYLNTKKTLS